MSSEHVIICDVVNRNLSASSCLFLPFNRRTHIFESCIIKVDFLFSLLNFLLLGHIDYFGRYLVYYAVETSTDCADYWAR